MFIYLYIVTNTVHGNYFEYILKHVSQYEQFESLKGGLFEHLCVAIMKCYKTSCGTTIKYSYMLPEKDSSRTMAQYDILIKTFDENTIICECKAYSTKMYLGNNTKGTFSYFIQQVKKYEERYPDENVSIIVFSANDFSREILDLNLSNYKNNSSEYKEWNQLISKTTSFKNTNASKYMLVWNKYFT